MQLNIGKNANRICWDIKQLMNVEIFLFYVQTAD